MVNSYILVNPQVEGTFKSKIKSTNSLAAANTFYKNLSEHFSNSVPEFYFSIQKGSSGDGKLYHFKVKETKKNDEVSYSVTPYSIQGETEAVNSFKNKLEEFKSKSDQDGGKKKKHRRTRRKDDSSDSWDDDSDDFYLRARRNTLYNQPISYWWYDPYLYRINTLYVPTIYSYTVPIAVELIL